MGQDFIDSLRKSFESIRFTHVVALLLLWLLVSIIVKVLQSFVKRFGKGKLTGQTVMVIDKTLGTIGFATAALIFLHELGFDVTAILGAAGILGIAIGFAAQTSISNVISGFFLISEKSFEVGDVVNVEGVSGVILSIDILSVKIKTFDNTFVRLPNEILIKSKVVNVTRFPIRRLDLTITLHRDDPIPRVLELLTRIAQDNRFSLGNPEPLAMVQNFSSSGVEYFLGAWFEKSDLLAIKNSLLAELQEALHQEGFRLMGTVIDLVSTRASLPTKAEELQ